MKTRMVNLAIILLFAHHIPFAQVNCGYESKCDGLFPAASFVVELTPAKLFKKAVRAWTKEMSGHFEYDERLQEFIIEDIQWEYLRSEEVTITLTSRVLQDSSTVTLWIKDQTQYLDCEKNAETRIQFLELSERFRKVVHKVHLMDQLDELKDQLSQARSDVKDTKKRIEKLNDKIDQLNDDLIDSKKQLQEITHYLPEIQKQVEYLEKMKKELEMKISEYQ